MNEEVYRAILRRLGVEPAPRARTPQITGKVRLGDYAFPWPDEVPGLGPRHVDAFASCADCSTAGSWIRYGGVVLCLPCTRQRFPHGRTIRPEAP